MGGRPLASRRLLQPSTLHHLLPNSPSITPSLTHHRTFFGFFSNRKGKQDSAGPKNPVLEEYMKRAPSKKSPVIQRGDLGSGSIFDDERKEAAAGRTRSSRKVAGADAATAEVEVGGARRSFANMSSLLDPRPRARERWLRKMVIQDMKRGGRLSKAEFIKKTERESVSKSANLKTSVKKLGPLARQITGKTVEEAITQMRFSKKKAAREVLDHLEYARDEAVVKRGMGLKSAGPTVVTGTENVHEPQPRDIQLKDGKRYTVTDPKQMYVDEAWVGRGPYGELPDYRARGRVYIMRTPWTHVTVRLKEEATRVRQYQDREEKRQRERKSKLWHPLPDRPIQGQRQWYSW